MTDEVTWLAFAGRERELTVSLAPGLDVTPLWNAIVIFMPGWPVRETGPLAQADISITGSDTDFTIQAESWDGGFSKASHVNDAANALAGLLIDGLLAQSQAAFCLHAAAVEIGGRAILFAGPSEAGKSTLALRLAARGCLHLADDRIFLVSDDAPYRVAALGLAAKIRKPLPPGDDLARLTEEYWFINEENIAYLLLDEDATGQRAANFGHETPLGAIVLPRRNSSQAGVALRPAATAEIVRTLITETTSARGAGVIVPAMTRLAEVVDAYILDYDDGAAAADTLLATFSKT